MFRIRVDLNDSEPAIWRVLDLRSDLTLDIVHSLLQGAFSWTNSHLHRFALGGGPFDADSQLFLCPFDVEEGEDEGVPTESVRLDETLQDVGDVLRYVYDYGDSWDLTLRLEQVREIRDDEPWAVCVAGERAAPPEDCGGATRGEDLATFLDDPAFFDLEQTNEHLIDPFLFLRKAGVGAPLRELLARMVRTDVGQRLLVDALGVTRPGPAFTPEEFLAALAPIQWYLDRAHPDGIELTKSGYLRPADVAQVAAVVPMCADWPGTPKREADVAPLLSFRESLQKSGLLRKRGGKVLLTKAGQVARVEPDRLWGHLASRLIPEKPGFERDAAVVALLFAALGPGRKLPEERIGTVMRVLGWRHQGGGDVDFYDVRWGAWGLDILLNVGGDSDWWISPVASALAREALFWDGPGST